MTISSTIVRRFRSMIVRRLVRRSANADNLHVQTELKNKDKNIKQYLKFIFNKPPKTETKEKLPLTVTK